MKWQSWVCIALLALFVVTLFLPRIEISGDRYVDMVEDVNEHIQDVEEEDGEDAVSGGAVSAAAIVTGDYEDEDIRQDDIDWYDEKIDDELDSTSMNNLFFGKWALTVDDTLYFEGTSFVPDEKIEDSGVQSTFKIMGILLYAPLLLMLLVLVLCIVNRKPNGILLIVLGAVTGFAEIFWRLMMPGMIWTKIEDYVDGFTSISPLVLHSDGMGAYTISSMISHFSSWGPVVSIVFAVIFVIYGILVLTAFKQKTTSFNSAMPDYMSMGAFGAGMGNMPPGQMGGMPPGQMGGMPQDQFGGMPQGQMGGMPQDQFGGMPQRQMGGMPGQMGGMPMGGQDQPTMPMSELSVGTVRCINGQYQQNVFDIRPGEEFVIGRDPSRCQLVLQYPKVSRKHCGIKFEPSDGTYLVRNYSSNGTKLSTGGMVPDTHFQKVLPGTTLYLATEKEAFILE